MQASCKQNINEPFQILKAINFVLVRGSPDTIFPRISVRAHIKICGQKGGRVLGGGRLIQWGGGWGGGA